MQLVLPALILLVGCASGSDPRPNVLLLVVEGLRADYLGAYGYRRRKISPHFDALSKSSLRFSWAYAPAAQTAPSVASILTGVDPRSHGATAGGGALDDGVETLAESFRKAGFSTGALVDNAALGRAAGFARGFDSFDSTDSTSPLTLLDRLAAAQAPWFAFVHDSAGDRNDELGSDGYDLRVSSADALLGELLGRLDELGIAQRTLLVLTADRGEALGERGPPGLRTLHEEVIRVPLLLRPPRGVEQRAIRKRVSLLSLAPTLLELAGIEYAPGRFQAPTLSEWLFGDPASPRTPPVFSELGPARAVIHGRYKLILDAPGGKALLYDLAADPHERRNIAARRPELREQLEQRIRERSAQKERALSPP